VGKRHLCLMLRYMNISATTPFMDAALGSTEK